MADCSILDIKDVVQRRRSVPSLKKLLEGQKDRE